MFAPTWRTRPAAFARSLKEAEGEDVVEGKEERHLRIVGARTKKATSKRSTPMTASLKRTALGDPW